MSRLAYLGALVLVALTVGGVYVAVDSAFKLDRGILEDTRTPIPGSRVLHLDKRKYNVFFEARDLHGTKNPPAFPLRVEPVDSDAVPKLKDYSGTLTISGSRDATAFATVRIPKAGRYRVATTGSAPAGYTEPEVVLGEPIGGRLLRIVLGAIVAVAAFLGALVVLVLALISRSRRRA